MTLLAQTSSYVLECLAMPVLPQDNDKVEIGERRSARNELFHVSLNVRRVDTP